MRPVMFATAFCKTNVKTLLKFYLFCSIYIFILPANEQTIDITLISPELGQTITQSNVILDGLISDSSVEEVKISINSQEVLFLPVVNGYFRTEAFFDQHINKITVFGANPKRQYFREEYEFINISQREKSPEELIPPTITLNHLSENKFTILSPVQYQNLSLQAWDNKGKITQAGYIIDSQKPVYLQLDDFGNAKLNLAWPPVKQTMLLHAFAVDEDLNRSGANYHFRVEFMECQLNLEPEYGMFKNTDIILRANIKGGQGTIKREFRLLNQRGFEIALINNEQNHATFRLDEQPYYEEISGELRITDKNNIEAHCQGQNTVHFYPNNHPRLFKIESFKFESLKQKLNFSIEPPIKTGTLSILLKKNDPLSGTTGQEWRTLEYIELKEAQYRKFWPINCKKRVLEGEYLMKLSMALGHDEQMTFTESLPITVTKSTDDTKDLLYEILRDEAVKRKP